MPNVYDEIPDELERQYLEWSEIPEGQDVYIDVETDPVPGPEHPVGADPDATSEYSVIEMDGTVTEAPEPIAEGEYRLAVSSARLARAMADEMVQSGDRIAVRWESDGQYRQYVVDVI